MNFFRKLQNMSSNDGSSKGEDKKRTVVQPNTTANPAVDTVASQAKGALAVVTTQSKNAELVKWKGTAEEELKRLEQKTQRSTEDEASKTKAEAEIASAAERKKLAELAEAKKSHRRKTLADVDTSTLPKRKTLANADAAALTKGKASDKAETTIKDKRTTSDNTDATPTLTKRKTLAELAVIQETKVIEESINASLYVKPGEDMGSLGSPNFRPRPPPSKRSLRSKKSSDVDEVDSTHKKHKYDKFDITLLTGPISELNYRWFDKRMRRTKQILAGESVVLAFTTGVLLYIHFIRPPKLFTTVTLRAIMGGKGYLTPLSGWLYCAAGYLSILYSVALIQYSRDDSWSKIGECRWYIPILLEVYMCACLASCVGQIHTIQHEVSQAMHDDLNNNQGKRLNLIQQYLECCGINSWKDWRTLGGNSAVEKAWHGGLCSGPDRKIDDEESCDAPPSCWYEQKVNRVVKLKNWDVDCKQIELTYGYSFIGVHCLVILGFIVASSASFWYIKRLVKLANKKNVDLRPKLQFEQCL